MNFRDKLRHLERFARVFSVFDGAPALPKGRLVLYSCHDADRSVSGNEGRLSPLLEGIRSIVAELGYVDTNLTHPFAIFSGSQIKGGSRTINYAAVRVRLLAKLERFLPARFRIGRLERETAFYRAMLTKLQPRAIISIQPPYALCRAARQMGILVIEPMHGTNFSMSDTKFFGAHMANPDELLPNVLVSFDDVTYATTTALTVGRDISTAQTGDPWLHLLKAGEARKGSPARTAEPSSAHRKQVLISLQWGYDGDRDTLSNIIPNGILHPAVEEVIATTGEEFQFRIRLHPIQMIKPGYSHHKRYIQSLAARYSNVEWEQATGRPLPFLLDEVFAQMTMSSGSAGEAASANIPTLLLCPTLHPGGANYGKFRELEPTGAVTFGTLDRERILAWLRGRAAQPVLRPHYDVEQRQRDELAFYGDLMKRAELLRSQAEQEREGGAVS
jgi:hypothetical protein